MVSGSSSVLSERYAIDVLLCLLKKGTCNFQDFNDLISSPRTKEILMEKLELSGMVTIKKIDRPRKTYFVKLTPLGLSIAADLKRANDRINGILPDDPEINCGSPSEEGDTVRE